MEDQNNTPQENNDLTQHEKKQIKKQQKEQERQQLHESKSKKESTGKIIKYGIMGAIILLIIFGGYFFVIKPIQGFQPYHEGFYHWHANFEVSVCGQSAQIRCGASLCGPMTMHHHNDNIIHIEGNTIAKKEDLAIGKFFDGINVVFTDTQLLNKNNGDLCDNGQPGNVKMYVNGQPNNEFGNYVPNRCDAGSTAEIRQQCDKIELKFE